MPIRRNGRAGRSARTCSPRPRTAIRIVAGWDVVGAWTPDAIVVLPLDAYKGACRSLRLRLEAGGRPGRRAHARRTRVRDSRNPRDASCAEPPRGRRCGGPAHACGRGSNTWPTPSRRPAPATTIAFCPNATPRTGGVPAVRLQGPHRLLPGALAGPLVGGRDHAARAGLHRSAGARPRTRSRAARPRRTAAGRRARGWDGTAPSARRRQPRIQVVERGA